MTTNVQQGTLLNVLKKKMTQTKEEMEKYRDECEDSHKRLQAEILRREERPDGDDPFSDRLFDCLGGRPPVFSFECNSAVCIRFYKRTTCSKSSDRMPSARC
ncbi:hypothetical protein J437_LFUL004590 [Ladona fulva]|uniref:Uncharacterized protein n=1 Tax=Ladona fulva TaxID=123851 RepID=A0A8K0K113_LADFU|nr:hypothetical protein J437_LFUL004590 [Ladona fulva]